MFFLTHGIEWLIAYDFTSWQMFGQGKARTKYVFTRETQCLRSIKGKGKGKGSPYSVTERRVPELIPVLSNQPAGDVSHKPGGRLPLLSARPAVTPATLTRAATNFAAWRTEARWV